MSYEFLIIVTNILINSFHLTFKLFGIGSMVAFINSNQYIVSSAFFIQFQTLSFLLEFYYREQYHTQIESI